MPDEAFEKMINNVCDRLEIYDRHQRSCVKTILENTIIFNERRTGELTEQKLESFVTILGGYVSEISLIADNPDMYKTKLDNIKQRLNEKA